MFWRGRGWWVTWLALLAMVLPMIVLRQVDGPEVDRGVALTMGLAALATLLLGLRWNRGAAPVEPARHSFWGLPLQLWAAPMLLFAVLLGTGTITTAEEPRADRSAVRVQTRDGGLK
jgi:hypothetical protein